MKVRELLHELSKLDPDMEVVSGASTLSCVFERSAGYDGPALFVREDSGSPVIHYVRDGTRVAELDLCAIDDVIDRHPDAEVVMSPHDRSSQAEVAVIKAELEDHDGRSDTTRRAASYRFWYALERFERAMNAIPGAPQWHRLMLVRSDECELDPSLELLAVDQSALRTAEEFEPLFDEILRAPEHYVRFDCLGVVDDALLAAVVGRTGPLMSPEDQLTVTHFAPSARVRQRPGWRIDDLVRRSKG